MPVQSENDIFLAVGEALRNWTTVEINLASLFSTISDMPRAKKAHAAFDSIISFETRADVVDALMQHEGLSDLDLETWIRCSLRARKLYKRRHALAHFSLVRETSQESSQIKMAPFLTMGKFMQGEEEYLPLEQIKERGVHFGQQAMAVSWFGMEAQKRRGQSPLPPGFPWPEPPLVARFRDSAAQTLEERKRKQRSPHPLSDPEPDQ